jgi:hypothetical protein
MQQLAKQQDDSIGQAGAGLNQVGGSAGSQGVYGERRGGRGGFGGGGGGGFGESAADAKGGFGLAVAPKNDASNATLPRLIASGDTLNLNIPQSGAPGAQSSSAVVVAEGTITLPLLGSMRATGLTENQLAEQITQKYRDANLLGDATVSVSIAPATQPVDELAAKPAVPGAQPAPMREMQQQASEPMGRQFLQQGQQKSDAFGLEVAPTSQPTSELVDVVIVLTADEPATQPAAAGEQIEQQPTTEPAP